MRVTLDIDDELNARAVEWATKTGRTLSQVVEDSLQQTILQYTGGKALRDILPLPTFGGRGVRPGINLDRTSELLDRIDRGDLG